MTKFFSKKGDKSKGPTHSQTVGLVWISAALLLFAGLVFFLPRKGTKAPAEDSVFANETVFLASAEDSFYRQRYYQRYSARKHIDKAQEKGSSSVVFDSIYPTKKKPLFVELNSADTLTLQLLHGIGPARARYITEYRERLGGFYRIEQLLDVYSITPELLADIAPHLTVDTTEIISIDINKMELKQLARHPYIEYYQARDIVRLRQNGILIKTIDDLRAVPSMNDTTIARLRPYLAF